MKLENIVVSPCCRPELELEEVFTAYAEAGYRAFEVFISWVRSAFDYTADPQQYLDVAARFGMRLASLHLPMISADDVRAGLAESIKAARFAAALGVKVVLFKASNRPTIIQAAGEFLDAIDDLAITPVLQNHYGTAISSLDDFRALQKFIVIGKGDQGRKPSFGIRPVDIDSDPGPVPHGDHDILSLGLGPKNRLGRFCFLHDPLL